MAGIPEGKLLRVTPLTHISSLLSLLIVGMLFFGILVYLRFEQDAVKIFGVLFLVDAIPALYLHCEYWIKNKGEEYEVTGTHLIRRKGDKETHVGNGEIEKITVYLSPSLYKNSNLHLLAIESYHYAVVRLRNGEEIVITCLVAPRVDIELKKIRGVLFEKKRKLFCMIS